MHRFPEKFKYQQINIIVYTPLLKLPFEAIISAKDVLIIFSFVDNLPLTNI